jgi:hypothetical protein
MLIEAMFYCELYTRDPAQLQNRSNRKRSLRQKLTQSLLIPSIHPIRIEQAGVVTTTPASRSDPIDDSRLDRLPDKQQAIPAAVERSIDLLTSDTPLIAIRLQRSPVEAYPLSWKPVYLGE